MYNPYSQKIVSMCSNVLFIQSCVSQSEPQPILVRWQLSLFKDPPHIPNHDTITYGIFQTVVFVN